MKLLSDGNPDRSVVGSAWSGVRAIGAGNWRVVARVVSREVLPKRLRVNGWAARNSRTVKQLELSHCIEVSTAVPSRRPV